LPELNPVIVSEKLAVTINQVFVYHEAAEVISTVGAVLSIRLTTASTVHVSTHHEEYSNQKLPFVVNV